VEPRHPMHFNPSSERYHYRKIASEGVEESKRLVAENAVGFFAGDLKIDPPSIQWITPEPWEIAEREEREAHRREKETNQPFQCDCFHDDANFLGLTPFDFRNEILVSVELDGVVLIQNIAHEMRHVWQEKERGLWRKNEPASAEDDANNYSDGAILRYPEYVEMVKDLEDFGISL